MLLALAKLAVHLLTNGQYGFHRDELSMLDGALQHGNTFDTSE